MNVQYLIDVFEIESRSLDVLLRQHLLLRPLFNRSFRGVETSALRHAYLHLLKLSADYVQYTVPALRAAGKALRDGDAEDQRWSRLFLGYAADETDTDTDTDTDVDPSCGHHVWARDDMRALGAPDELVDAPPHPAAALYGRYFVEDAARHPYAILGAKGVLEHWAIRSADDLARGVLDSGIPHAENATRFFHHHGLLDIDHVREGDRNLRQLAHSDKCRQILEGAYMTSGTYRSLIHHLLPT